VIASLTNQFIIKACSDSVKNDACGGYEYISILIC